MFKKGDKVKVTYQSVWLEKMKLDVGDTTKVLNIDGNILKLKGRNGKSYWVRKRYLKPASSYEQSKSQLDI